MMQSLLNKQSKQLEGIKKQLLNISYVREVEEIRVQALQGEAFNNLSSKLTPSFLEASFCKLMKGRGKYISDSEGQNLAEYACEDLDQKLENLSLRVRTGSYEASKSLALLVPKNKDERRIVKKHSCEDKILQFAVAQLLGQIFEPSFLDTSFAYRPGLSIHDAVRASRTGMKELESFYLLTVDLNKFFDTVPHQLLLEFIETKVTDPVILRLIEKWLKAGVKLPDKGIDVTEMGVPQGSTIAPILANIFLHEVFDTWFEDQLKPELGGECFMVRYGDDITIGVKTMTKRITKTVLDKLKARFTSYGISLNSKKTKSYKVHRKYSGPAINLLGFTMKPIKDNDSLGVSISFSTYTLEIPKPKKKILSNGIRPRKALDSHRVLKIRSNVIKA